MFNPESYMYICFYSAIVVLLLSMLSLNVKSSIIAFLAFFLVYFTSLVFGLRNPEIGIDSIAYIQMFKDINYIQRDIEPLFVIYLMTLRFIGDDPHIYLLLTSLLINLIIIIAFKKLNPKYYLISFALFFVSFINFLIHLSMHRQGIATAFVILAIAYLVSDDLLYYIFFSIIAFLFHASAFFVFLFWPLKYVKLNKIIILIALITFFILYKFPFLTSVITSFSNYHWTLERLYWYLTWGKLGPAVLKPWHIMSLLFIVYILIHLDKFQSDYVFNYLYKIYIVGILLFALVSEDMMLADRMYYYFYFIGFILITKINILYKEKLLYFYIILFLSFFWAIKSILLQYPNWFIPPYKAILGN